jgi:uncharacterized membrane protein YphA (DoxX/SURF4 family)
MLKSYVSIVSLILRLVAAIILLQTLYFKFSAHPESVALFTRLGVEPWGRVVTGCIELVAGILLLWPKMSWMGAGLGLGLMSGAILSHLTVLGIASANDGGQLFFLAGVVWMACLLLIIIQRKHWINLIRHFTKK